MPGSWGPAVLEYRPRLALRTNRGVDQQDVFGSNGSGWMGKTMKKKDRFSQLVKEKQLLWQEVWALPCGSGFFNHLSWPRVSPLLGIHTEETRIERDTCTPMFIAALFLIARTWKQPRCPSADEWIRKLWYIYTMEYYTAIKKNTFKSVLMRWMKLEPIIQNEVSQKEKHQYSILTHIYMEFREMVTITLSARQQKRHSL